MNNIGCKIWDLIERIVYTVLNLICKLINKNLPDGAFETFMQFIKFGIVGLSNTAISYILYVTGLLIFQRLGLFPQIDYIISSVIGFVLSVLWSFYWNNRMVFKLSDGQERSWWKSLVKTYISYSFTGLFLSNVLLVIWVQVCQISEMVAPLINLLVSVPLNFLINKFWTFKGKD